VANNFVHIPLESHWQIFQDKNLSYIFASTQYQTLCQIQMMLISSNEHRKPKFYRLFNVIRRRSLWLVITSDCFRIKMMTNI